MRSRSSSKVSKINSRAAFWNLPRLTGSIQIHTNSITSNLIQTSHLSSILQNLLLGSIFKAFTGLVSPLELGSEKVHAICCPVDWILSTKTNAHHLGGCFPLRQPLGTVGKHQHGTPLLQAPLCGLFCWRWRPGDLR